MLSGIGPFIWLFCITLFIYLKSISIDKINELIKIKIRQNFCTYICVNFFINPMS